MRFHLQAIISWIFFLFEQQEPICPSERWIQTGRCASGRLCYICTTHLKHLQSEGNNHLLSVTSVVMGWKQQVTHLHSSSSAPLPQDHPAQPATLPWFTASAESPTAGNTQPSSLCQREIFVKQVQTKAWILNVNMSLEASLRIDRAETVSVYVHRDSPGCS